jgi:ribosomal protein S27E
VILRGVRLRTKLVSHNCRDTLAVTARAHAAAMIYIECAWCETEVAVDGLDATSVECPDCNVTVDFARDETQPILVAA